MCITCDSCWLLLAQCLFHSTHPLFPVNVVLHTQPHKHTRSKTLGENEKAHFYKYNYFAACWFLDMLKTKTLYPRLVFALYRQKSRYHLPNTHTTHTNIQFIEIEISKRAIVRLSSRKAYFNGDAALVVSHCLLIPPVQLRQAYLRRQQGLWNKSVWQNEHIIWISLFISSTSSPSLFAMNIQF